MKSDKWADEIHVLEEGIKSDFWKMISRRGLELHEIVGRDVRDSVNPHRDYSAGKLVGLEEVLGYPETRMKDLRVMLRSTEALKE